MNSLLFPIIMLAVTLIGGGIFLMVFKNGKNPAQGGGASPAARTAQQFINVADIRDKCLYTCDGTVFTYLRVQPVSMDLYSNAEKAALIKTLTAELSDIRYPFKFMAMSRPVDIAPLVGGLNDMLKEAGDGRKELLRQEILQMGSFALSGEIVERQFYIALWEYTGETNAAGEAGRELQKRAALLCEKFAAGGIACAILGEKEIVRLLNLVNNPAYTQWEDCETSAGIPMLKGVI